MFSLSMAPGRARAGQAGLAALFTAMLLQAGCATQSVKRVDATPPEHAETELPEEKLVNINIAMFDPNIPESVEEQEAEYIFPEVRKAESRYMPVMLRDTLQSTGQWGAVRVVPEPIPWSELLVTGRILQSDGLELKLQITAEDASGREWLDRTYSHEAAKLNYRPEVLARTDPFQAVYNQIADDLLEARRQLESGDLVALRRVSELRFGADIAPAAYSRYLASKGGRYTVKGLPATDDPFRQRIEQIRARDYALIDSLDQHYQLFRTQIDPNYDEWRSAAYTEVEAYNTLSRQSLTRKLAGAAAVVAGVAGLITAGGSGGSNPSSGDIRRGSAQSAASVGAIAAGVYMFKSGLDKGRESELHAASLEELGRSLESDVKPTVVELENQTVTLSGSAEQQYEDWRKLLHRIYAEETGLVSNGEDAENQAR